MPVYCSVPQCTTKGTGGMHRFPADPQLKRKWMDVTRTQHLQDSKSCRICRKHFKDSDLLVDQDGKRILAPNAVPSLCLPMSFIWDHSYHVVGPPKKRHFKRLKITGPGANISDDNIGNEIEVGAARPDKSASVGSYKDMEFLRSLEEKILQQKKFAM
ncbi:52 kDa repressor of the inhibitor of the protein kinase-like isoform X3 [Bradysia coprophila]|uniref:52 kDa repressor of the inhibitor of the protein kinase-like isoform X3 n=1 Tax=Bradysia coprophila TaxID=38358 RepID=UPI00187D71DF|nr:52 kDa repressor of the inhibitor of the protein kinase-like isoform X3 [Bradysia coprophila]